MAGPITAELARTLAPVRPAAAHKGAFGHALIIAGSPGMTGAGCLAGDAAARAGAGLVTVACPAALHDIFEIKLTEVMTWPAGDPTSRTFSRDMAAAVARAAADRTAVGLGPGLGLDPGTGEFVCELLPQLTVPAVIDADGLNHVAQRTDQLLPLSVPCVLTPHPGEMSRLTGLSTADIHADREGIARTYAERWQCTVVLKGAGTVVAAPDGVVWTNTTGNQGMASGGTGDVLTGLIAGLLAQGCRPEVAACLAVYLHGWAGDAVAGRGNPRALVAGDLLHELAAAWRALMGHELGATT